MNPLDWNGPQFLFLYVPLLVVGSIVVWNIRQMLRTPWSALPESPVLSSYQAAYLGGGAWRAFSAALARLFHGGAVVEEGGRFSRRGALHKGANDLETALWNAAEKPSTALQLYGAVSEPLEAIRKPLLARGLILDDTTDRVVRLGSFVPMFLLTLFGLTKIIIGLGRGGAVGFLTFLTIVAGLIALNFLMTRLLRSRRGDTVLAELRLKHDALGRTARTNPAGVLAADLPLALALFGTAALAAPAYAALQEPLGHQPGGKGGSCGGGESSCGGGSDGGGCGGGGCGGCGGGGGD